MKQPMYHIEDLETLLLQKEFGQLLEDERAFVLQHITNEDEYTQMRSLLFKMIEESQEDEHWQEPDPRVKRDLDALFESASDETPIIPFFRSPLFWSVTGIAATLVIALLFFWPTAPTETTFAQAETSSNIPVQESDPEIEKNSTTQITPPDIKPKPPLVEQIQFTDIEITEEEEVASNAPDPLNTEAVDSDVPSATVPHLSEKEILKGESTVPTSAKTFESYEFQPQYSKGEQELMKDTKNCVQRALQRIQWEKEEPSFKIYVQLNINTKGKVKSVVVLRGGENHPQLLKEIQNELLSGLSLFNVPAADKPTDTFQFNLPLHIQIQ